MTDFSLSAEVGQACTQAPQDTHSDDRKSTPAVPTFRIEAAPQDRQRERALDLLAGAHAARTDDACRGIEGKIGIGGVDWGVEMIGAVAAIAHLAQADDPRLGLELAIAVGAGRQAVERMVGA